MDLLSDALATLRLIGKPLCRLELVAPWGIDHPEGGGARFYVMEQGEAELLVAGQPPLRMLPGEFVLLPHGPAHVLRDRVGSDLMPLQALVNRSDPSHPVHYLRAGGTGQGTVLLAGALVFQSPRPHPVLEALPPVMHLRGTLPWLQPRLEEISREAKLQVPGMVFVIGKLRDLLFMDALRAWIQEAPATAGNWLGALKDPVLARALGLMHRHPERAWTLAALARECGAGRSSFAERFLAGVGVPPMAYLQRWRMDLACTLLAEGELGVKEIAAKVGYGTEVAFSRAFKREAGLSPRRWAMTHRMVS